MQKIMAEALLCFPLLQILPLSHTLDSIGIVTVREHLTKMNLTIKKNHKTNKKTKKKEKPPTNY